MWRLCYTPPPQKETHWKYSVNTAFITPCYNGAVQTVVSGEETPMLQLKNIVKTYAAGENAVTALRGVSLDFRRNEFVSILGPSGCGKTTLLNIVGGLDQYTSGDLIINGKSTRAFGSRDWDTYRNHTIGFVFQSYNLIPHQSVLQNVELALTLSGVPKAERRRRAKQALEQVGLGTQLRKKPGEMSGGQMQRVAIARALVNNPDIILADEPTGALDTETSVQVMELLKEVAKDRLVVMVTHNPELAERYSTRIIRMLDGQITGDTAPLTEAELAEEAAAQQEKVAAENRKKRPSMSLFTSFGLSLKNLFTKKGRTALTSFAGSIGIIGIALIYAVSQGTTAYIEQVQEDTLASYPLTLEATHVDISSLMTTFMGNAQSAGDHANDAVYQKNVVYDMVNSLNNLETNENDLASFKRYLEEHRANPEDATGLRESVSGVQYGYDTDLLIYTKSIDGTVMQTDATQLMQQLITEYMGSSMAAMMDPEASSGGSLSQMFSSPMQRSGTFQEMLPGDGGELINPLLKKQYDLVYGSWPTRYNEMVLVLDENNELGDITLYALGLKSKDEIDALMDAAVNKTEVTATQKSWSYEEICAREYRTVLNAECYIRDEKTGLFTDLRDTDAGVKYLYDNGIPLTVSGIIRPNEDAVSTMLTGSIAYTGELTREIIRRSEDSAAVQAQKADESTDIFTGLPFKDDGNLTDADKQAAFREVANSRDEAGKAALYTAIMSLPSDEELKASTDRIMTTMTRENMEATLTIAMTQQMGMSEAAVSGYLSDMREDELTDAFRQQVEKQVTAQYAQAAAARLAGLSQSQRAAALTTALDTYTTEQCAAYYDRVLEFSDSTYEDNLTALGCIDLDKPSTINLYTATFAGKDVIEDAIAAYNDTVDDLSKIRYTDYVGLMMSSVTTIIDAITYVLIGFVAISLIVSSIMIGVITLISVQERTKEIGILRAIGASKRDVSGMFNAETMIIGFTSGLLGVLVTYLLCIPINALVHHLTGIQNLSAYLPLAAALVLIAISVLLTLISGIIPSRSAAKKDPVVALRTE